MKPEQVNRVKKKHLNDKNISSKYVNLKEDQGQKSLYDDVNSEDAMTVQTDLIAQVSIEECVLDELSKNEETSNNQELAPLLRFPTFELTYEEEFKIYELLVRKENLMDRMFRQFSHIPGFVKAFEQNLFSLNCGGRVRTDFIRIIDQKFDSIHSNFVNGGTVRKSLDMFDEFKNVSERVKTEALSFSISVFQVCNR